MSSTSPSRPHAPLPGSLQASFVVESDGFAWWGVDDPAGTAEELGLPPGDETSLTLALPDSTGRRITPRTVPATLVAAEPAVAALSCWSPPEKVGCSLRVWARIAAAIHHGEPTDGLIGLLPTAGHAVLGLDRTTIWSASAAVDAARRAVTRARSHDSSSPQAVLRPYQRAGVAWLRAASEHGGGVLADDMGLGKTVQAIALLWECREHPNLVVCPTSLLGNWSRELARFAPDVDVLTYTGPDRLRTLETARAGTVVLTTYGVLRGDAALSDRSWQAVVLDEAQQIKNPGSLGSRAARELRAELRIAMTGTPVENRLDELWSLMAFTNPGLLGTHARFRRRFVGPVQRNNSRAAAQRLHEIVGPHVLRRRKEDVAPELPSKLETSVVCTMTDEQERLYRASLNEAFEEGFGSGTDRRGRILALLTRLKQICNHPELVSAEGTPLAGRSGKLDRATEMLAELTSNGARALVFTQYRKTGELLAEHFRDELATDEVPFLHGGLGTGARQEIVTRFQEDPQGPAVLILSLRAAGFGLNLTRATHVLHYDRWWNPAVEDQASDRAHRIGQDQTVTVHTLLTERTLEEAIAEMHEGKRALAGTATGETAGIDTDLTRLSDEQLHELLLPRHEGRP
ncbi:DEAD/DEAH box helicase [Actinopolyspora mortivallis]|uniref:Serine/threonine protein kinase n=1 Tax=Actinopolyspora mortivallis TaxID=33906 RepID=A0A2T0GYR1_ACTMO|nr:DEAD/DEAH box helicase [Actinopolyspora mortivallis]PRW64241.1 serine/threonine protein kinase [Actinopolyspora mortivallis]